MEGAAARVAGQASLRAVLRQTLKEAQMLDKVSQSDSRALTEASARQRATARQVR